MMIIFILEDFFLFARANIGLALRLWNQQGSSSESAFEFPYGDFDLGLRMPITEQAGFIAGISVIPPFSNYLSLTPFAGVRYTF